MAETLVPWSDCGLPKISRKRIICTGHAYVALSRLRTLGGLILRGFSRSRVRADPQVRKLYKELLPDGATARLMEDVSPDRFRCLVWLRTSFMRLRTLC